MHFPFHTLPVCSIVASVALWLVSCGLYGLRYDCLALLGVAIFSAAWAVKQENKVQKKLFLGSGKTPAWTQAYELILKSKGKGDDYFTTKRDLAFADLDDFSYVRGAPVSLKDLLKHYPFTIEPWCLHDETQCVIFVETPMAFDCAMVGPFYFSTQRQVAKRLFAVPYAEFNQVCAELEEQDMSKLLLLYNTSRCGSTLVSKGFDSMAGVQSISEPDVFTSLTHIAMECKEEKTKMRQLTELAASSAKLLLFLRTRRYPDRPVLALKFRFQVTNIAHMLKQAIPDARSMYLYRNALDVIDSMAATFINNALYGFIRSIGIDCAYVFNFSSLPLHMYILIPLFGHGPYPIGTFDNLGAVSPFVLAWISGMAKAREALLAGDIQLAFRYEDVCSGKEKLLEQVLLTAGVKPTINEEELSRVFSTDSQKNSAAASSRRNGAGVLDEKFVYLRKPEIQNIMDVIARHPIVNNHNFILPKTVMLKE